ncbi:MAG: tRNA (adenosine(37)-N6)-dimethylallyltransferase MiaA [Chitinophagaceae bacterium]
MKKPDRNDTVIIIAGPTGIGKTALAIELALHFHSSIISADSRQCFRELNLGTAKPNSEQLSLVPHYFINSHSIVQEVNAGIFERLALNYSQEIFAKDSIAILCGGTGLYVRAFYQGIDSFPPIPNEIRNNIIQQFQSLGLEGLQKEIRKLDPVFFEKGEIKNPQRLMRALEVKVFTGKSIYEFQNGQTKSRDFNTIKIGLNQDRNLLKERINHRVDLMLENGLLREAEDLFPFRQFNALQTVGYRELFDYFEGKIQLEGAIEKIKINTWQYAKRQLTWFKKEKAFHWFDPDNIEGIFQFISSKGI